MQSGLPKRNVHLPNRLQLLRVLSCHDNPSPTNSTSEKKNPKKKLYENFDDVVRSGRNLVGLLSDDAGSC